MKVDPLLVSVGIILTLLSGCVSGGATPSHATQIPMNSTHETTPFDQGQAADTPTSAPAAGPRPTQGPTPAPSSNPPAGPAEPVNETRRPTQWSDPHDTWPPACPPNEVPARTSSRAPTTLARCIGAEAFTVGGRTLGFSEDFELDWVRPGMNLGTCSTAFMIADDEGDLYLSLSAHCFTVGGADPQGDFCTATYEAIGTNHTLEGYAEPVTLAWTSGRHMQTYGATAEECSSWDVAFVKLPETLRATSHPAIKHLGGPTGLQDPLLIKYGNSTYGYGQSIVRSLAYEAAMGEDMGNNPALAPVNMFSGYFAGDQLDDYYCRAPGVFGCVWNTTPYGRGLEGMIRYPYGKTEGDSGSSDLMADGKALGVTAALDILSLTTVTSFLYDTFLRIWFDTGERYALVTWDEWSPTSAEG